jgi:hypothetical protein
LKSAAGSPPNGWSLDTEESEPRPIPGRTSRPSSPPSGVRSTSLDFLGREVRVLASLFPLLASITVPVLWAIGAVLIIAGIIYMFRHRMLLGVVLLIIGILLGGLNIFGVFD